MNTTKPTRSEANMPVLARPGRMAVLVDQSKSTLLRDEKKHPSFPKPARPSPRVTLYSVADVVEFYKTLGEKAAV